MDAHDDLQAVTEEIEALHREFEDWFHDRSESLDRVDRSLSADFLFIPPAGAVIPRPELLDGLRAARGTAAYRIGIEDVDVHWRRGALLGASYVEVHRHDDYTTRRRSSAVFERDDAPPAGLRWLAVHETWLEPPPA